MSRALKYSLIIACSLGLAACAATPLPFKLYDAQQQVWPGQLNPHDGSIIAHIEGKDYRGFYLVAHGTAVSSTPLSLFADPPMMQTVSQIDMNTARASLSAGDGSRLTCSFLFQGRKILGNCHDSQGHTYDLAADGQAPSGAPLDPR